MNPPHRPATHALHMLAVGRLFDDLSMGADLLGAEQPVTWRPPTDVYECDDNYVVRMAVSGLKRRPDGNIRNAAVTVENDLLTIRGHRTDDCPRRKHSFRQMEIHYGYFECRIRICAPFDRDHIHAAYRDGFLTIVIPKAPRSKPGICTLAVRFSDPGKTDQ